jgi:hypothetical protein
LRRAVATALIECLGGSHASTWLGDRPDVLRRTYVELSKTAQAGGAQFTSRTVPSGIADEPLTNELGEIIDDGSDAEATTYSMGGTGFEPVTSGM